MAARAVPKRTASTSSRPAPGQSRQGAFDGGAGDVLAAVVVGYVEGHCFGGGAWVEPPMTGSTMPCRTEGGWANSSTQAAARGFGWKVPRYPH